MENQEIKRLENLRFTLSMKDRWTQEDYYLDRELAQAIRELKQQEVAQ